MNSGTAEPIRIWTDGAVLHQSTGSGPGGWAYVKSYKGVTKVASGFVEGRTTNVRMEMVAPIQALRSLKRHDTPVIVHTDLQMLSRGFNEWLPGWIERGWVNAQRKPIENRELWEELVRLTSGRSPDCAVSFVWVKGHAGIPENERADRLANQAAEQARKVVGIDTTIPTLFDLASGLIVPAVA